MSSQFSVCQDQLVHSSVVMCVCVCVCMVGTALGLSVSVLWTRHCGYCHCEVMGRWCNLCNPAPLFLNAALSPGTDQSQCSNATAHTHTHLQTTHYYTCDSHPHGQPALISWLSSSTEWRYYFLLLVYMITLLNSKLISQFAPKYSNPVSVENCWLTFLVWEILNPLMDEK